MNPKPKYVRQVNLPKNHSFFLFGARGTGKSTLLKSIPLFRNALVIDFLNPEEERLYSLRPMTLVEQVDAFKEGQWVVLDEVQKVPKLLDVVHQLIEAKRLHFALTGSSARKLKRGGANLLAGRAFLFSLFPLTSFELEDDFKLQEALEWGTLPKIKEEKDSLSRKRFLTSYVNTYLKEEILIEQVIRKLEPFRLFLSIAAQMDGRIINFSNIAKDSGVDHKMIQRYFQILEDTHLGFFLNPFGRSVRKVQKQNPKFYFFDSGVQRALSGKLGNSIVPQTNEYGDCFESWVVNEISRQIAYKESSCKISYLRTKDDVEVDLLVESGGHVTHLVEIKSAEKVDERHVKNLLHFRDDFPSAELVCLSRVKRSQKIGKAWVLPWQDGIRKILP